MGCLNKNIITNLNKAEIMGLLTPDQFSVSLYEKPAILPPHVGGRFVSQNSGVAKIWVKSGKILG